MPSLAMFSGRRQCFCLRYSFSHCFLVFVVLQTMSLICKKSSHPAWCLANTLSIILRAFQGIGASGIYAMILAIAPSLVPISKYAKYMGVMSTVFITASVLGPILGGVISQHSTWRWVFLLKYAQHLGSLEAC
jgi:MFS family permease